jgi:hypothetical protein
MEPMKLLVDTSVWLDLAKDYRHQSTIHALEVLIQQGDIELAMPRQVLEEFERSKERVVAESNQSLASVFRRVKDTVWQFGSEAEGDAVTSLLDNVGVRVATLGGAASVHITRLEKLFAASPVIETTDDVVLRAGRRALGRRAPFHKTKNSMGDAILIEQYADLVSAGPDAASFAFVTHNKHDFSNVGVDERLPHPDIADLFAPPRSTYSLSLGELLNDLAPEWMEDLRFELEYQDEPRRFDELMEAHELLWRQVWYNRHLNLRHRIETGQIRLVSKDKLSTKPYRSDEILDTIWAGALEAAKRTEDEVGLENLGPWSDFKWGMVNGKLSAVRWVLGSDWDDLDT